MQRTMGVLFILFGIVFGLWAGIWWAFIGGIVDVVNAFKATNVDSLAVAAGVAKFFFAGVIGWAGALIPVSIGSSLLE